MGNCYGLKHIQIKVATLKKQNIKYTWGLMALPKMYLLLLFFWDLDLPFDV